MSFGCSGRIRRILQQNQFTPDPEQLWNIPAFVTSFATCKGRVDGLKSQRDLAGLAQASGQFAEQEQEARQESCLTCLFKPSAQRPQPGVDVALPGGHQAAEAAGPDLPQTYRMTLGVLAQHRAVTLGGIEVASPKGDRTCAL